MLGRDTWPKAGAGAGAERRKPTRLGANDQQQKCQGAGEGADTCTDPASGPRARGPLTAERKGDPREQPPGPAGVPHSEKGPTA